MANHPQTTKLEPVPSAWLRERMKRLVFMTFTANIVFVLVAIFAGWPEWWIHINYEQSHLTWFSSTQLLAIATCSLMIATTCRLPTPHMQAHRTQAGLWFALAGGFTYLALDEKFQIHERLREGIFKPHAIGTALPIIAPGDFLFLIYAVVGLAVGRKLLATLAEDRASRGLFLAALVASIAAVALDAFDIHSVALPTARALQFTEEMFETAAQAFFLTSFMMRLSSLAGPILDE